MSFSLSLACSLMLTAPAHADLILRAEDFNAVAGSHGSFIVTLTNTGAEVATLSAYQIQLDTDLPSLMFTGVDRAPLNYVFPGTVQAITSDFPGPARTSFTAIDFSDAADGFDLLPSGVTFGILRVHFAVDPGAPSGMGHVHFVSPGPGDMDLTQLADGSFNLLEFTPSDGKVEISATTAVPEPSGVVLLSCGVVAVLVGRYGRRIAVRARAPLTRDARVSRHPEQDLG